MAINDREIEFILKLRDEASALLKQFEQNARGAGTGAASGLDESTKSMGRYGKETSTVSQFIREQRAEQREQNFLFRQGRDVVGAAAIGLSIFGNTLGQTDEGLKKVTNGLNQGFVAFQGLNFLLAGVGGPWGMAISLAGGIGAAIATMGTESEETKEKIRALDEELNALRFDLGEISREQRKAFLQEQIEAAQSKLNDLKGTASTVSNFIAEQFQKIVPASIVPFLGSPRLDIKGTEEDVKKAETELDKLKKKADEFDKNPIKVKIETDTSNIDSKKIVELAGATARERLEIERKYELDKLSVEEKALTDAETNLDKRNQIHATYAAKRAAVEAEHTSKVVEFERDANTRIKELQEQRATIIREAGNQTVLTAITNVRDRIKAETDFAVESIDINTKEAAAKAQLEGKSFNEVLAIVQKGEAEKQKARAGGAEKVTVEERRIVEAVRKSALESVLIVLEAEKQKELAHARSADERVEIETRYRLKAAQLSDSARDRSKESDEERTANDRLLQDRLYGIEVDGEIKRGEAIRQQAEQTWGAYRDIVERNVADSLKILAGLGPDNSPPVDTEGMKQELALFEKTKKRENELADINDKKERDRLAKQLADGEISRREYELRLQGLTAAAEQRKVELESGATERRKKIEEGYAQNSRSMLDDLEDVWARFWEDVVSQAIEQLAKLAVFDLLGGIFGGGIFGGLFHSGGTVGSNTGVARGGYGIAHEGGVIDEHGVLKFHDGGNLSSAMVGHYLSGFPGEEIPIIAQVGETVRTRKQERQVQELISHAMRFHEGGTTPKAGTFSSVGYVAEQRQDTGTQQPVNLTFNLYGEFNEMVWRAIKDRLQETGLPIEKVAVINSSKVLIQ